MNTLDASHPLSTGRTAQSRLIGAYRGVRQPTTPVWFMRQAGRSLPEYRELRVGTRMLDACLDPALASEITLQPVRRHGVDAAIFFSDIVIPLRLAGVDVDIVPGKGPVLASPIRTAADVAAVRGSSTSRYASKRLQVASTTDPLKSSVCSESATVMAGAWRSSRSRRSKPAVRWLEVKQRSTNEAYACPASSSNRARRARACEPFSLV